VTVLHVCHEPFAGVQGQEGGGAAGEKGREGRVQGDRAHRGHPTPRPTRSRHQEQVGSLLLLPRQILRSKSARPVAAERAAVVVVQRKWGPCIF